MKEYKSEKEFLDNYDESLYKSPSLTVDTLVFAIDNKKNDNYRKLASKSLQILLVKRKEYPEKDKWGIPGGFINIDEELIDAANRRLREEVGKPIWMWTGYTWNEIQMNLMRRKIVEQVDVLIDGRFELDKRDLNLKYKGSSNQRVIDVKKSLENKEVFILL